MDYQLGDKVTVVGEVYSEYRMFLGRGYRLWRKRKTASIEGIVVRRSWKKAGRIWPGSGADGWGDFDPPTFEPLKQILVYEIAFNINRKPIMCMRSQMHA